MCEVLVKNSKIRINAVRASTDKALFFYVFYVEIPIE
jgi:hypothetical protein